MRGSARVTAPAPRSDVARPSIGARFAARLVRGYQVARAGRPSPCRYDPTCSAYALDAFEHHGLVQGGVLAIRRIGRCHPWGGQGWDPVPESAGRRRDERKMPSRHGKAA